MAIQVALHHRTQYRYGRAVALGPHILQLRPSPHDACAITWTNVTDLNGSQSILSAIALAIVTAFIGLPPEDPLPQVEPKLLAPTLHSRNASTASLYSLVLSQDSDSLAQTTTETVSSRPRSNPVTEKESTVDFPSSPATPVSQRAPSGSSLLQVSKDAVSRGQLPIRRIASQMQADCKKRRPLRKSTSPPTIVVSLPPPLTPIPSADPSTPSLSEQQSTASHGSGSDSPRPTVSRSVTSPTSGTRSLPPSVPPSLEY